MPRRPSTTSRRGASSSGSERYDGCDGVMLQHLLHDDLDAVALIGRLGQQLV
jgi:hypothetical protein